MKTITEPLVLNELIARFALLTPESQRQWGTMTPGEMLCHIGDNLEMGLDIRPVPVTTKSGWANRLAKFVILGTEIPFPKGVPTRPGLDPRRDGTKPVEFERDRARVINGLRALAIRNSKEAGPMHGRFGAMTMADWQRQAYRHTDHHLKQFGV